MSKKTDKALTVRLESVVLDRVQDLCNKIENKLYIISTTGVKDVFKRKVALAKAYSELLTDVLSEIGDLTDQGTPSWQESMETVQQAEQDAQNKSS